MLRRRLLFVTLCASFAFVSCASRPATAPPNLSNRVVDARRLPISAVMRSYFRRYPIETTEFRPSALGPAFRANERRVVERFDYRESPRELFDRWMSMSPNRMWDGPSSYFSLLLVPTPGGYRVYDRRCASFPRLRPGMLVFLRLELDVSLEIPVAFAITRVDDKELVFQITYLEQNASHGVQTLRFLPHDGGTTVVHDSRFASNNRLRDLLYPLFHRRLVTDFHRAMEIQIEK